MLELNKIYCGDCTEVMPAWDKEIADCCVTSPPYWGLRDYGLPPTKWPDGSVCCYGLEPTIDLYVSHTVLIFAEVWRVLKPEGTLWLNLGDTYNSGLPGSRNAERWPKQSRNDHKPANKPLQTELKTKDLCGIPWRVAFALQAAGWYLRQDIIWHKPNPMPESVQDRCTKAHEYIFLMSKNKKYYYDIDAIRVKQIESNDSRPRMGQGPNTKYNQKRSSWNETHNDNRRLTIGNKIRDKEDHPKGKNKRDVWTVPLAPFPEAHFATFPPALIEPCILAGCPEWVCKKCGKARVRIVERGEFKAQRKQDAQYAKNALDKNLRTVRDNGWNTEDKFCPGMSYESKMTGWTDCGCNAGFTGGLVLDPFMGSGTTALVAYENNRNYIGCELSPKYVKLNRADKAKAKYGLFE